MMALDVTFDQRPLIIGARLPKVVSSGCHAMREATKTRKQRIKIKGKLESSKGEPCGCVTFVLFLFLLVHTE